MAAIADKVFAAWYNSFNIESVNGFFWDNAEMMEVVLDGRAVGFPLEGEAAPGILGRRAAGDE